MNYKSRRVYYCTALLLVFCSVYCRVVVAAAILELRWRATCGSQGFAIFLHHRSCNNYYNKDIVFVVVVVVAVLILILILELMLAYSSSSSCSLYYYKLLL